MRVRSLAWLIALLAFVMPPSFVPATAMASADHATMSDCPNHAPPPAPCPEKGTAKHAAGLCCPAMAGSLAVLPAGVPGPSRTVHQSYVAPVVSHLTGLSLTKDPPPPRV
jgi:hypothetical protein